MEGGGEPGVGLCVYLGLRFPTKPCPEAIDEIFRSKFHIIGASRLARGPPGTASLDEPASSRSHPMGIGSGNLSN
ncbi:CD9 [Cervus elaphus hippelaphus]|uniref:CD9 n=1 Tax=Cervus elaphus hippelaphus TaxID=46360 RepID=A0A212CD12_CEREH|nr:CD9 [Cervus elaphus hippelaphus]